MTMFQIMTQKGWLDIMHSTMRQSKDFSPLVALYFMTYHVFVTLVCLFCFVSRQDKSPSHFICVSIVYILNVLVVHQKKIHLYFKIHVEYLKNFCHQLYIIYSLVVIVVYVTIYVKFVVILLLYTYIFTRWLFYFMLAWVKKTK